MTLDRREDSETERRVRYRVTFNANVSSTPWCFMWRLHAVRSWPCIR